MAWKALAYNRALAQLSPEFYGCPTSCRAPAADKKRGCPDCEVTVMYKDALEEIDHELAKLREDKGYPEGHKWSWSVDSVWRKVGWLLGLDASHRRGYKPTWPVPVCRALAVVRQEKGALDAAEAYNRKLEAEARTRRRE